MLVLTRRQQDKVTFPGLGITVHVVRVDGKAVRLGIEAPDHVRVLRHELADQEAAQDVYHQAPPATKLSHAFRNRLNAAFIGIQLLSRQLEMGKAGNADAILARIVDELRAMDSDIARLDSVRPATAPPGRGLRALLVEDNDNEAELLAGYLQTFDYEVRRARDGAEALDLLASEEKPHIILLDMTMPRLDGRATIKEIRTNPSHAGVKVFAVTGMSQEAAHVPSGREGPDRWFQKPIRPDVLVREIHRELAATAIPA
ncbi:MAG: response regulator [Pirellulaceae bacterium]